MVVRRWLILITIALVIQFIDIIFIVYGIIANATSNVNIIAGINLPDVVLLWSIIFLIASITFVFTNKKLLKRNNKHSKRENMLREGIIEYFAITSKERGIEQAFASQITTMQSVHSEFKGEERNQRSWIALLTLIPWIGVPIQIYILYILTQYDVMHDRRWHTFAQQVQSAGQTLGITIPLPSSNSLPHRPFWRYLIAYIVTLGLFQIYWYHALMNDGNEHYEAQWRFEDQLIGSI